MLVVGLTGGIASGKSTVSSMLRQAGAPVICLDELAHEVVTPGRPAFEDIRRAFGNAVLTEHGDLDRAVLGSLVFTDSAKRKTLESIVHPRVREEVERRIGELESQGHALVVVDVPLLYEVGWDGSFDVTVVVYVPRQVQETRLATRDNISLDEIRARIGAQLPIEEKKKKAHFVVDNAGSLDSTYAQVVSLLTELKKMADLKKRANPQSPVLVKR